MTTATHTHTAQDLLAESDKQFAAGEHRKGSETLWRAAECAMTAVAQQRGWKHDDYKELLDAAKRLSEERNDISFVTQLCVAEMFHKNFIYGFLEDYEPDMIKPTVHRFVRRLLELLE